MIVYRLATRKFKNDISGTGARLYGGRWNSRGTQLLYTSSSIALCTLEIAVRTPLNNLPTDYFLLSIYIPESTAILQLPESELPRDWSVLPHGDATQRIGDNFAKNAQYLTLKVPSASAQGDFNFLLNPFHSDFSQVKIIESRPFEFDSRLFIKP